MPDTSRYVVTLRYREHSPLFLGFRVQCADNFSSVDVTWDGKLYRCTAHPWVAECVHTRACAPHVSHIVQESLATAVA